MIPLDPDRSGFSQAAFAGWFWCVAPWGPSIGRSEHVSGADGPAEECWICWIGHKAQISEWRRLSQSHWQIDMFHMCIRTHTYNTCIYCPYDYHIWYDFYLYAYLRDLLGTNAWSFWQQHPSLMCFWKFRGDATKQLEHKPQSQRPAMPQTAQNLPDVTNASGRKSDEHMSKPLMRSPKSRCYSARVCYSLWGSDGMHFYNYAGPQTKKSHAFAFLFWCIACCSFSILYSMSISFEGQLKLNHRNVMKCYSHACHNWLILVVGLPCFPYFPVVADHLQVLVPQASGEYVTECHRIHAVDEEFGKHQEAQRKIIFFSRDNSRFQIVSDHWSGKEALSFCFAFCECQIMRVQQEKQSEQRVSHPVDWTSSDSSFRMMVSRCGFNMFQAICSDSDMQKESKWSEYVPCNTSRTQSFACWCLLWGFQLCPCH